MDSDLYYLLLEDWRRFSDRDKDYLMYRRLMAVQASSREDVYRREQEILGDEYEEYRNFLGE